jgi:hypothetical protein
MIISADNIREHDSAEATAANDTLLNPFPVLSGSIPIGGTIPMPAGTVTRTQGWQWIDPVTFIPNSLSSKTFNYTASFVFTDPYGNVYRGGVTTPLNVVVSVGAAKLFAGAMAGSALVIFAVLLAAGIALAIIAVNTPYPANIIPTIAAGVVLVAAFAAWGLAIWFKAQADDPPIPDFSYSRRIAIDLRDAFTLTEEENDVAALRALHTFFQLMQRIQAAYDAMNKIQQKILGASVDGAENELRVQREDYRSAHALLQRAGALVPDAAAEFEQALTASEYFNEHQLKESWQEFQRNGLPESLYEAWKKRDLPLEPLNGAADIIRKLGACPDSIFDPFHQICAALKAWIEAINIEATEMLRSDFRSDQESSEDR